MDTLIKRLIRYNRAVLITALFFISGIFIKVNASTGIWVTRDYATSRDNIDKVLDFCVKHNIDDVYFQIRGRGDAFYKSRFIPMSPRVKEPDFDPLAYICEQAMPRKLKIHAWFNTYILYSNAAMKPEDTHIYTLFPEWTSTDKNGFNDASLSFNKMRNKNFEGSYLSPVHPKVNQYIYILIREIIDNYTVDGIHLDYIRFQNKNYGFNPVAMNQFKNETGVDPRYYMNTSNNHKKSISDEMFYELYDTYRVDAVNNLIKKIKKHAESRLVPVMVSAAVKSNPQEAKDRFFQDWLRWLNEDWVDYVVTMNYNVYNNYKRDINLLYTIIDNDQHSRVYSGVGLWKLTASESKREIDYSREMGFNNIVYFSYTTFLENPEYIFRIKD